MKLIKYALLIVTTLILTGCATVQNSAFDGQTKKLDFSQNSYFVMGVEINHAVKPKYNPNSDIILFVQKIGAKSKSDRFSLILKPSEFQLLPSGAVSGYFRGALPPGDYTLGDIIGFARKFPINGSFTLPLESNFRIEKNEVAYLGKLRARTRKKRKGEFAAGSVIPLLDQAVSGFASSTFDVQISDDSESAKAWMNKAYPVLASEELSIRILPKYDRSKFDDESVEPQADPVFIDEKKAALELTTEVGSIESAYPEIVIGLNSQVSVDFQRAAAKVSQKKLYTDSGVLNVMIARIEQVVENPALVTDRYQIDAFAHCVLNVGKSDDSRSEPLLNKVVESGLHKKIKSHASHALRRKNKAK